jgi:glycosyltransferase involved in cell wall biosynthesis
VAERLRVLVAGWLNSPHVAAWAEAVSAAGHDVHVAGRVVPNWPELELPVPSHRLSTPWPPPVQGLRMSAGLRRVAATLEPDIVHAHYLPEFGWMAAREGLRPLVCSAWGSDVLSRGRLSRWRSRLALASADLVFADSVHLARETAELAGRDLRVEVVRWGLDLERFAPGEPSEARAALGLPLDGPLVAGVRGLRPIYNPVLQLEAFARVRGTFPGARFLLKHPLTVAPPRPVQEAIERLGLEGSVTVLGSVSEERLPDVYRAADVVVSVPSSDSSPRSVWEALACGRPVVASDLPWARDELVPGEHAILAPLEADAVAAAIIRVLEDAELARRLGAGGRALAAAELGPERCAARIDSLYRELAGARP